MDFYQQLGRGSRATLKDTTAIDSQWRARVDLSNKQILRVRYVKEYQMNAVSSNYSEDLEKSLEKDSLEGTLSLRAENQQLKQQLAESYKLIQKLNRDLTEAKAQALLSKRSIEPSAYEQRAQLVQIAYQIKAILEKNQQLTSQINTLKTIQELRLNSKSFYSDEHLLTNFQADNFNKENNSSECFRFVKSLEDMQTKIQGKRSSNLQQLWRWIKHIGQHYSKHRRQHKQQLQIRGRLR